MFYFVGGNFASWISYGRIIIPILYTLGQIPNYSLSNTNKWEIWWNPSPVSTPISRHSLSLSCMPLWAIFLPSSFRKKYQTDHLKCVFGGKPVKIQHVATPTWCYKSNEGKPICDFSLSFIGFMSSPRGQLRWGGESIYPSYFGNTSLSIKELVINHHYWSSRNLLYFKSISTEWRSAFSITHSSSVPLLHSQWSYSLLSPLFISSKTGFVILKPSRFSSQSIFFFNVGLRLISSYSI